jgi:hypothetical protein
MHASTDHRGDQDDCGGRIESELAEELGVGTIVALIRCRLAELTRAGCHSMECVVLATRLDIEIERATELVGRGCPPELAVRILL